MFGVFRLRSGRDSPTPPPFSVLLLLFFLLLRPRSALPLPFALAAYDVSVERRKRFYFPPSRFPSTSPRRQIFHLDLIPVLSPGGITVARDSPWASLRRRSDRFGSCYAFCGLFTTFVKNCTAFRGYEEPLSFSFFLPHLSRSSLSLSFCRGGFGFNAAAANNFLSTFQMSP